MYSSFPQHIFRFKLIKSVTHVSTGLFMLALLLLTSCSKTDTTLMDSIPADADFVAVVDMGEVVKNIGCEITSDGPVFPPEIQSRIGNLGGDNKQVYDIFANVFPYIDAEHLMAFALKEGHYAIFTYLITDAEGYAKAMEELSGSKESRDGYTVYPGNMTTVVKGNQAWMTSCDSRRAADVIAEMLDKASEKNFTSNRGLAEFIGDSGTAGVVVNLAVTGLVETETWVAAHITLGDMSAKADIQLMMSDGEIVPAQGFCNVDKGFLRYVPESFNYAVGVGVESGESLAGWLKMMMPMLSFEQRGMLETALPFISKVKGTVAVAGRADGRTVDELGYIPPMLMMVKMEQADVDESVQALVTLVRGMGASVAADGQGRYEVSAPGMKVYIGNVDGSLGISTVPFEPTKNSHMASVFKTCLGGAYFMMPSGFDGTFNRDVLLKANLQQQSLQIEMAYPDTKEPFLKTYIESLQ